MINNAGISGMASFLDVPLDMIERIMQVNFWSVVYGCKAFLPQLLGKPEAHIVNISSIEGIIALPSMTAYTSSKFAVRGFTEVLKLDLGIPGSGFPACFQAASKPILPGTPLGWPRNIWRNIRTWSRKWLLD